jgi:DNA modification methylase
MKLINGNCLEEMKKLPDKSVDLLICDLPYGQTNCGWDIIIDMEQFWFQFKRLRKSKRTACIHFCSTKFGYSLIKSWERGFKFDLVWKKRNKTGGLASRYRPMRNHEMVYFFYEQAPKYNRDKYHKRINNVKHAKSETTKEKKSDAVENEKITIPSKQRDKLGEQAGIYPKEKMTFSNFEPPNPASVIEEKYLKEYINNKQKAVGTGGSEVQGIFTKENLQKWRKENGGFEPPNPVSVVEEQEDNIYGETKSERQKRYEKNGTGAMNPPNPASVIEEFIEPAEDEPLTMFESKKVFIGKRNHQTEKPQDILEFFLKYWSDEGDTILDPTMGSGSTGVACKKMGREFIGIELTEKYYEVAKDRCGVEN